MNIIEYSLTFLTGFFWAKFLQYDGKESIVFLILSILCLIINCLLSARKVKKTSAKWQEEYPEFRVIDPDGWDRENYEWSWNKEKITHEEYKKRLMRSTVMFYKEQK